MMMTAQSTSSLFRFSPRYGLSPAEWLLLALFLLAPLYFHPNLGGTGLRIPNNIIIWFFATLFGFYSLYQLSRRQVLYLPPHVLLWLAFPVLAFFSGIISGVEIPDQWTFRNLYIWGGVLFFLSLFQWPLRQGRIDRLLLVLLLSGFLHALVGFSEIIWRDDLPGWIPTNPNGVPTGLFQQINVQASFQVTTLLIGLWLLTRPLTFRHHGIWKKWLIIIAVLCATFIVAYAGSRVGLLGLMLALPLLLISRWSFIKRDRSRWLLLAVLMTATFVTAQLVEQERGLTSALDKATAMNAGFSGSARLGIYKIAIDLIEEKPVFGYGIGSFPRIWQLGKPAFYAQHPDAILPPQRVAHPHNELLFWLVEGGLSTIFGLLCVLLAVLLTLKKLPASRRYAYAALLLPVALHTQVELPFYISALPWFVFLFLLFVISHPHRQRCPLRLSEAARRSLRGLSVMATITVTVFLSHTMIANLEFKQFMLEKTTLDDQPLATALNNPYFKQLAAETLMVSLYFSSMKHHITENVQQFVQWSDQTLNHNPHIRFFRLSTQAHIYLNQGRQACSTAWRGHRIYPDDEYLTQIVKKCRQLSLLEDTAYWSE